MPFSNQLRGCRAGNKINKDEFCQVIQQRMEQQELRVYARERLLIIIYYRLWVSEGERGRNTMKGTRIKGLLLLESQPIQSKKR